MSENGQTHFKNLAAFAAPFWDVMHERVKNILLFRSIFWGYGYILINTMASLIDTALYPAFHWVKVEGHSSKDFMKTLYCIAATLSRRGDVLKNEYQNILLVVAPYK